MSLGQRLLALLAIVVCVPLLLGGLIAAGELGDGRLLGFAAVLLVLASGTAWALPVSFPGWGRRATPTTSEPLAADSMSVM